MVTPREFSQQDIHRDVCARGIFGQDVNACHAVLHSSKNMIQVLKIDLRIAHYG